MARPTPTRIQTQTAQEILRLLRVARDRIRRTLEGAPTDYQRWQLAALDAEIRRVMAEMSAQAGVAVQRGIDEAWTLGASAVNAAVAAGEGASVAVAAATPQLDARQLNAMRVFATGRIRDITEQVANRINSELGLVIIGAQTPVEAIAKVAALFGKGRAARERALTIVRTELGRAFSVAAQERLTQAAEKVEGLQKMWRRSGKLHSRPGHDALDGEVRDLDEPFEVITPDGAIVELQYPHDPKAPIGETINCGCTILPYKEGWGRTRKKPFSDAELAASELRRNPVKASFKAQRDRAGS